MSLGGRIEGIYKQAAKEVEKKLVDFLQRFEAKDARMRTDLESGKITEAEYKRWLSGQVFIGKRWAEKLADVTKVYTNADEKARQILNEERRNVFVEYSNAAAKDIERHVRTGVTFELYDKHTVERLIKDNPKLLPEWKIDEPKDYIWNERRVQNAVTQGIIQGESVRDIGKRLANELSTSNRKHMEMFARTAVTGAENAGRMERMREAVKEGIKMRKVWSTVGDDRVRDAHQELDGEERDVDEPFEVFGQTIDYPGDPNAAPELTYNCRCTLLYSFPRR